MADVLAGQAADIHTVPNTVSADINNIHRDLRLIQRRHIAVTKLLPPREHNKVTPEYTYKPTYNEKIQEAATESKHACVPCVTQIYLYMQAIFLISYHHPAYQRTEPTLYRLAERPYITHTPS